MSPVGGEGNGRTRSLIATDTAHEAEPPKKRCRTSQPPDSAECKICQKQIRNDCPGSSGRCKKCLGALLGAWKIPVCRTCNWFYDYGQRGCLCDSKNKSPASCSSCEQRRSRDDYFFDAFPRFTMRSYTAGTECFVCQPRHLKQQWSIHRAALLELGRHGIQMYDCDPVISRSPFRPNLPPAKSLAGQYDILYTRWETIGNGQMKSPAFGDILQKRAIHGSLKLSLPKENKTDQHSSRSYSCLEGIIELPKSGIYTTDMEEEVSDLPENKRIAFRFADGSSSTAHARSGCLSVDSRDETHALAFVEDLSASREISWDPQDVEERGIWKAYYGSRISLQLMGTKSRFEWIPRDDYEGGSQYAADLRQQISQHSRSGRDWNKSWLCKHMGLPENACQYVHDYMACFPSCFQPTFEVQEGDLWLSLHFDKAPRRLSINFLARRKV